MERSLIKAPKWKLPDGWKIVENPTEDQLRHYGLYEQVSMDQPTAIMPKGKGGIEDPRLCVAEKPVTLYRFGYCRGSWWTPTCVKMYAELKQSVWKNYAVCPDWNDLTKYGKMQYQGYAVIGETAALDGSFVDQTLGKAGTTSNKFNASFSLQVFLYLDAIDAKTSKYPENKQVSYEEITLPEKFKNQFKK